MFNVIIAGTRTFDDYDIFEEMVDKVFDILLENYKQSEIQIISGNAKGVDKLGEAYAKENGYKLMLYPANWDKYGKKAGPIRNSEMIKIANYLIVVWDGISRGTKDIISKAKANKIPTAICKYRTGLNY